LAENAGGTKGERKGREMRSRPKGALEPKSPSIPQGGFLCQKCLQKAKALHQGKEGKGKEGRAGYSNGSTRHL